MRNITQIVQGLKNLWKWIPIIWSDRDFDHNYLLIILRFKLLNMCSFFLSDSTLGISSAKDAKKMWTCVLLLNRLITEDYSCWEAHNKRWGELEFICKERGIEFKRENVKTNKEEQQERKEFKRCILHEDMLRKQDYRFLFKLLNKHTQTWWD